MILIIYAYTWNICLELFVEPRCGHQKINGAEIMKLPAD